MELTPQMRYVRLGLRLGRLDDGVVDAYFGPAGIAREIEAEPPPRPRELVAEAEALHAELPDGWLRDQVVGLHTCSRVLAGEQLSYADEVEGYYGIRPPRTDEAVFAEAHERLAELLPGAGPVRERLERWRRASVVPGERVEATSAAVIAEARAQTLTFADLPEGEGIELEMVRDVPWLGYNFYLGDLRGRVCVNDGMEMPAMDLLLVAIHETYPGHQAERALRETLLVRAMGRMEETIALAPTPQSVVTEGIGRLAPQLLLAAEEGERFARIVRAAGVEFDLALALEVERVTEPCRWAEVNAALMLHQDGVSEPEVASYLERWALLDPAMIAHLIRYLKEPSSRTYLINGVAGFELCGGFVGSDRRRFVRLLTEQFRVSELGAG